MCTLILSPLDMQGFCFCNFCLWFNSSSSPLYLIVLIEMYTCWNVAYNLKKQNVPWLHNTPSSYCSVFLLLFTVPLAVTHPPQSLCLTATQPLQQLPHHSVKAYQASDCSQHWPVFFLNVRYSPCDSHIDYKWCFDYYSGMALQSFRNLSKWVFIISEIHSWPLCRTQWQCSHTLSLCVSPVTVTLPYAASVCPPSAEELVAVGDLTTQWGLPLTCPAVPFPSGYQPLSLFHAPMPPSSSTSPYQAEENGLPVTQMSPDLEASPSLPPSLPSNQRKVLLELPNEGNS